MSRKAPEHCKHKPMYEIRDYHLMDAEYRKVSDVYSLSVGKAQWDDNFEPSVKVWRKTDSGWSRQSEETTFTRAIDMAMIVLQVIRKYKMNSDFETFNFVHGQVKVDNAKFQHIYDTDLQKTIDDRYETLIKPHIEMLKNLMKDF